jgi:hypothetical protein
MKKIEKILLGGCATGIALSNLGIQLDGEMSKYIQLAGGLIGTPSALVLGVREFYLDCKYPFGTQTTIKTNQ